MTNPHKGSSFDSFLEEEGIKEELQKALGNLTDEQIMELIKKKRKELNE